MKALVTGANGFLGSHLTRGLLEQGWDVRTLTRQPPDPQIGCESFQGDLRDLESIAPAFAGIDVVFHAAALTGIWGDWQRFYATNTVGTRHVVECCLKHGIPRLVYTSSPSVTFDGQHQIHVDESAPYASRWLSNYPRSKALAEEHVLQSHDPPRLMTCALRPHLIWGPGDRHLIPRLIQRARKNQLRRVGEGTNQVDLTFIDNAVQAHLLAAEALQPAGPAGGKAYFISDGEPVNCWEFVNDVLKLAGLSRVRKRISFYWAWRLGAILETAYEMINKQDEPRMTRFLAAQLAKSHYYDISRARQELGYQPQVSHTQGLRRLAENLPEEPSAAPAGR